MVILLLSLLGCPASPTDTKSGDSVDSGFPPGASFCEVRDVFDASCTICHNAGNAQGALDLSTDPRAAIVGVASGQASMSLVAVGDSAGSYLYLKMSGDPGITGLEMPTAGPVDAAALEVVRSWIDGGALDDCSTTDTDTGRDQHHPEGYDGSSVHGLDAKLSAEACVGCHGVSLDGTGSGVACDDCHGGSAWRTDCTWCHGGDVDTTGAPPVDIDGSSSDLSFPDHPSHVSAGNHAAYGCEECHAQPADVLSSGHLFVGDSTPGTAEVSFALGGSYLGGASCDVYCHGSGQPGATGVVETGAAFDCNTCHNPNDLAGSHLTHLTEHLGCEECHADTVVDSSTLLDADLHVDGLVEIAVVEEPVWDGSGCTGACHGHEHEASAWED